MVQKGLGKGLGALLSVYDDENDNQDDFFKNLGSGNTAPKTATKTKGVATTTPTDTATGVRRTPIVTRVTKEKAELEALVAAKKERVAFDSPATPTTSPRSTSTPQGTVDIEISLIDTNINQPRKEFVHEKLEELADSIRANGVVQPIVLVPVGSRFMIVAGERRWRASKIAGLRKIPAVVRNFTPAQIAEIAIVENLQRENLNEIELARGIRALMDEFNLTQEQASIRLGKNRSHIAHTLRLLTLPPEILVMVEQGQLSAGHGRCLVTIADKNIAIKLARQCIQHNLSVRELEKLVFAKNSDKGTAFKPEARQSLELKEMQRELADLLRTKVSIQGNNSKGKITIDYFTTQDLIRIRKHIIDVNKLVSVDKEVKQRVQGIVTRKF